MRHLSVVPGTLRLAFQTVGIQSKKCFTVLYFKRGWSNHDSIPKSKGRYSASQAVSEISLVNQVACIAKNIFQFKIAEVFTRLGRLMPT